MALELTEGRVKLVLDETVGRFGIQFREDLSSTRFVSLLFDQDPRTSYLTVVEGNRVHRMGDATGFRLETTRTDAGARFEWRSPTLEVIQEFRFVRSPAASVTDAIAVELTIRNTSQRPVAVGARYLFDTHLGEPSNIHFTAPGFERINRETELSADSTVWYWRSPARASGDLGFQHYVFGPGITPPDRIVFANWKRLHDQPWDFTVNPSRNFNLLPYSVNDSAAAVYYDVSILNPSEAREIVTVLGNSATEMIALTDRPHGPNLEAVLRTIGAARTPGLSRLDAAREELLRTDELLRQIDYFLASDDELSDSVIDVIQSAVEQLERRSSELAR